ncbi:MAG: futalosine hydrolase [Sphingobacteriales bacterium]|nr:MAG: futalosine hydrolase [Sphingobacteriales bacterium]
MGGVKMLNPRQIYHFLKTKLSAKLGLQYGLDKKAVICIMNILISAATEAEIAPFIAHLSAGWNAISKNVYQQTNIQVVVLVTGVGIAATTYTLTRALSAVKYDLVLQVGIAGTFDSSLQLGNTVFITTDQWGDLGAEDHDKYLDIFGMGLMDANAYPFSGGKLNNPLSEIHAQIDLPQVSALTVNMVSGNERTIVRLSETYNCTIESMEGAAFHYVCIMEQVPFAQVRSISNYIEPRDRSKWQIGKAVKSLNEWLMGFIENL